MSDLQLQYVINATMGSLEGLTQLTTQLQELKRLANEGADFGVRIDPTGLNGIKDAVAKAVAAGVQQGGSKPMPTGMGGIGGTANDLDDVVIKLENISNLLRGLAGGGGVLFGPRRGPAAQAPGSANLEQAVGEAERVARSARTTGPLGTNNVEQLVKRIRAVTRDLPGETDNNPAALEELIRRLQLGVGVGGSKFKREYGKKIEEATRYAKMAASDNEESHAMDTMLGIFRDMRTQLLDKQTRLEARLQNERAHARNTEDNQAWRGDAARFYGNSPQGNGGGRGSLAFNQASADAAFQHAADVFAQRLLAYLPTGAGGSANPLPRNVQDLMQHQGAPSGPGAFEGSGYIGGSAGRTPVGKAPSKKCPRCNGSGKVPSGRDNEDCYLCGGSGDINNPNIERLKAMGKRGPRQAAGATGFASAPGAQAAVSYGATGYAESKFQYDEILQDLKVPVSMGVRNRMVREITKLDMRRKKVSDPNDIEHFSALMAPLIDQYDAGGVPYKNVKGSKYVVNGMLVTPEEHARFQQDPTQAPVLSSSGGAKWAGNNPIRMATTHVNELTASLQGLQGLDLGKLESVFEKLNGSLTNMAVSMNGFKQMSKLTEQDAELNYTKLLNQEKERHALWENNHKTELRQRREADMVMANANRIRAALGTAEGFQTEIPESALSGDKLQKTITRRFRTLERLSRKKEDLELERNALTITGGNLSTVSGDMLKNNASFQGQRSGLLRDLLKASKNAPRAWGFLESEHKISDVVAQDQLFQDAALNVRKFEEARKAAIVFGRNKKQQKTSAYDGYIADSKRTMEDSAKALQGLGIGDGGVKQDVSKLKLGLLNMGATLDPQIQGIIKLAGAHSQAREAAMEHLKGWDLLARKLRDVAVYAVAAGAVYGAANVLRQGIADAVKFESVMADVQGIFVSKSPYQRAEVQAGVMAAAQQYGVDRQQVAAVAKTFAQTGASPEKTLDLTRNTLLAQRGAGLNADQASEMLIAVDNITGGRVKSGDIIDRISRVEARHAVTAQDLSTVIQKVGPLAEHMQPGMFGTTDGLDVLMGAATSMIEKTRMSGAAAGTTIKFLMARLAAPQVQKKLQDNFGVMLGESNGGQMRAMSDIFGDVASRYKGYMADGDTGKATALLTTFAGARQAAAAAAMFDDWKSSMKIAEESSLAFGDTQRRLAIQMDTMEAKTGQLNAAFGNFSTAILEKTSLLGMMKGATDAGTWMLQKGSENPYGSTALVGTGLLGLGGLAKSAWIASFLKEMPVMSRMVPGLGTAAAIGGALVGGYGIGMGLKSAYYADEIKAGDRATYLGPEEFNRTSYDASEQGKDYAATAGKYGFTPDGFFRTVIQAADTALKDGERQFGPETGDEKGHQKLGRFLETDFVKELDKVLPGFKDLKDETQKTAIAMSMLRSSMQFHGVSFFAQQAGFQEKADTLIKQFEQAFNASDPSANLQQRLGLVRRYNMEMVFPDERPDGKHQVINMKYEDAGTAFNKDVAEHMPDQSNASRRRIYAGVLNSFSPELGVGNSLSRLKLNGADFYSQIDNLVLGYKTGEAPMAYGKALDKLSESIVKLTEDEKASLEVKKKKNTITKDELAQLEKYANYLALVKAVTPGVSTALDVAGRKQAAGAAAPGGGVLLPAGGGAFAAKLESALNDAASAQKFDINDNSPEAIRARAFAKQQGDPAHRERTRLDIIGSMAGVNMKAYLRDKVMEEMLRYGERKNELQLLGQYGPQTGQGIDLARETAANDNDRFRSFIKLSASLPMDRIRAANRLNMAIAAGGTFTPEAISGEIGPDIAVSDSGLAFVKGALARNLEKAGKTTTPHNDQQIQSLVLAIAQIKRGVLEWQKGAPDAFLDSLSDADKEALIQGVNIDPRNKEDVARYGPTMQAFWLNKIAMQAGSSNHAVYKNDIALLGNQTAGDMAVAQLKAQYDRKQAESVLGIGVDDPRIDVGAFGLKTGMVAMQGEMARAVLERQAETKLSDIHLKAIQRGAVDSAGNITDYDLKDQAQTVTDSLKSGVFEANLDAQRNMLQLLDDTHIEYLKKLEDHQVSMMKSISNPIADVLGDPARVMGSHKFGDLATSIGGSMNKKLADSFVDNLIGKDGLFGKQFQEMFSSPLFMEASMIKQAHIDGITLGMRAAYGTTGLDAGSVTGSGAVGGTPGLGLAPTISGSGGGQSVLMALKNAGTLHLVEGHVYPSIPSAKKVPVIAPADKIKMTAPKGAHIDTPLDDASNFLRAVPVGLGGTGTTIVGGASRLVGSKSGQKWAVDTAAQMQAFYHPDLHSSMSLYGSLAGGLIGQAGLMGGSGLLFGGLAKGGLMSTSYLTRAATHAGMTLPLDVLMAAGSADSKESLSLAIGKQALLTGLFGGVSGLHAPTPRVLGSSNSGWRSLQSSLDDALLTPTYYRTGGAFDPFDVHGPSAVKGPRGNGIVYHGAKQVYPTMSLGMNDRPNALLYGPGHYFTEEGRLASTYAGQTIDPSSRIWDLNRQVEWSEAAIATHTAQVDDPAYPQYREHHLEQIAAHRASVGGLKAELAQYADGTHPDFKSAPNVRLQRLAIYNPFDIEKEITPEHFTSVLGRLQELHPNYDFNETITKLREGRLVRRGYLRGQALRNDDLYSAISGTSARRPIVGTDHWGAPIHAGERTEFGKTLTRDFLKSEGYDGITHTGGRILGNEEHKVWIAFDDEQVLNPGYEYNARRTPSRAKQRFQASRSRLQPLTSEDRAALSLFGKDAYGSGHGELINPFRLETPALRDLTNPGSSGLRSGFALTSAGAALLMLGAADTASAQGGGLFDGVPEGGLLGGLDSRFDPTKYRTRKKKITYTPKQTRELKAQIAKFAMNGQMLGGDFSPTAPSQDIIPAGSGSLGGALTAGFGGGGMPSVSLGETPKINTVGMTPEQVEEAEAAARTQLKKNAALQLATLAAVYTASSVFSKMGVRGSDGKPLNYATEGSQLGMTIGATAAPLMGPLAPLAPILGAALGGFVGSRFGKEEQPVTPVFDSLAKIERNTREQVDAIKNQTRTLLSPENRLLYAPSTFQMPGYKPFDAGQNNTSSGNNGTPPSIQIIVNGAQDPTAVAEQVAAHLKEQLASFGTFTDSRF